MKETRLIPLFRKPLLAVCFVIMAVLWQVDAKGQRAFVTQPDNNSYVTATLIADTSAIQVGKPFHLGVELSAKPGWHTYYKDPGEAGMPTKIEWTLPDGFVAKQVKWEKPIRFDEGGIITFGYLNKTLISTEFEPPGGLETDKTFTFKANVKWLSCRELCVPGGTQLTLSLPVWPKQAKVLYKEEFAKANFDGAVSEIAASEIASHPSDFHILDAKLDLGGQTHKPKGLLAYLLFALIGGLILNFMPCVLPVVAIKLVSLLEYKEDKSEMQKMSLAFVGGIISSFLVLALLVIALQTAGHTIGWGFQFQYPPFLIVMSTLVLLFALSLFGLFDISIFTTGQVQVGQLANNEGIVGSFFKGVLATILSTPCTAPFLGTALGFAFVEPWWVVLSIFLAVGIGMSLPYLLMMLNGGWIKYLPKPGQWMVKLKEAMGFVLLVTVVWLLIVLAK
jgi:DsbC/DsbD-like thiol-disulfide interchange protein/cytochrome c biogenesis protein CcdA